MQRLSVIADLIETLPTVQTDDGESLNYDAEVQSRLDFAIASIHPLVRSFHEHKLQYGSMVGIDGISDEAYKIAMDGWERPNDPVIAYWYSKGINEKIHADIRDGRTVDIVMLSPFGDGDRTFPKGGLVRAAHTWAMLAIHSGYAREATEAERAEMAAQLQTEGDDARRSAA